ncbi:response regulator transcription factor [Ponticaulis profundi]|uniref:Response regulator n=1 Tax=Ponticaulis profundi TaxID=2665222 RepID=A0ABW1SDD9_9PROT
MAETKNVLIIEDHPLFREALVTALGRAFPSEATALEADSISSGLDTLQNNKVDLVLLDLNLTDSSNFDGLTRINAARPNCPIYVVSATEGAEAFNRAKALGATGYLPKSLSLDELAAALATALDGGSWFPEVESGLSEADDEVAARIASLTPAQRRVLSGLSDGLLNKQIAFDMGISEATVKAHMTAIFRKLGANNRTQALLVYKQAVSISGDDHSAA